MTKLMILDMKYSLMSNISTLHTTGIIVADTSKFTFVCYIPEAMLRDVPLASKLLERYRTIPSSGFHPLTPEMHLIIVEADKPKTGG